MKEDSNFLEKQIITYIGNKRKIIPYMSKYINYVRKKLGKEKLITLDLFSGSGIVARYLKQFSNKIMANDLELYSSILNKCYLSNKNDLDLPFLKIIYNNLISELKDEDLISGFITKNYAPENDEDIQEGERVFYTNRNAKYIDTCRQLISKIEKDLQVYYLAPLLVESSIHVNTSGVFKGFYKDKNTGIGKFGGTNENALSRIKGDINLEFPYLSNFDSDYEVFKEDACKLTEYIEADFTYIDPPYNQHPYGSNYFMLNLISEYKEPDKISKVSGIPTNWNRSIFNKKGLTFDALCGIINNIKSKYLLISFNSEGFVERNELIKELKKLGKINVDEIDYNTFRGSRNLRKRNIHVTEYLFFLERNDSSG